MIPWLQNVAQFSKPAGRYCRQDHLHQAQPSRPLSQHQCRDVEGFLVKNSFTMFDQADRVKGHQDERLAHLLVLAFAYAMTTVVIHDFMETGMAELRETRNLKWGFVQAGY